MKETPKLQVRENTQLECKQNQSFSNLNFKTNKILHKMHSTFFSSRRKVRICFNKFGFYF